MAAPARPPATFRATDFVGKGTYGRVYFAEPAEDPVTADREGAHRCVWPPVAAGGSGRGVGLQ